MTLPGLPSLSASAPDEPARESEKGRAGLYALSLSFGTLFELLALLLVTMGIARNSQSAYAYASLAAFCWLLAPTSPMLWSALALSRTDRERWLAGAALVLAAMTGLVAGGLFVAATF